MNIFKKIAVLAVTAYARRIYNQAAEQAEKRLKETGCTIFVISDQFRVRNRMLVLTYKEYCAIRDKVVYAPKLKFSFTRLQGSCWYHTANRYGDDPLTERQLEVRRRAFIKDCLKKARLL